MPDDRPSPFRSRPTLVRDPAVSGGRARRRASSSGPRRPRVVLLIAIAALLLAVLVGFPMVVSRLADLLWYRELGLERVFLTKIVAQWTLAIVTAVVAIPALYLSVKVALRETPPVVLPLDEARPAPRPLGPPAVVRLLEMLALPVCVMLALLMALVVASAWRELAAFWYRTPFGVSDPVFGRDVGFYVFTLPVLQGALGMLQSVLVLSLLLALPIYLVRGDIGRVGARIVVSERAQLHGAVLVALMLLVTAVRLNAVDIPSLLLARRAPLTGASYTDLHARIPALRLLSAVAVLAAVSVLLMAWRGRIARGLLLALGGYAAAALLLGGLVPMLYQRLVVQPNELARERPQIVHHIAATRQAWRLDSVERRDLSGETALAAEDIARNRPTIDNVRLWDRDPLLQTFGQIQAIRTYYDFIAVDDDRYRVDGELRQVLLSARELNTEALPTRTFINEHLTFTHGMGLTLGPANQVTEQGLPVLFIKDLPPASSVSIRVTRPQIYFGEESNDFVLAPTRQREFDYPAGEGDEAIYSSYEGTSGVSVGSLARRLLFALRFGSLNILLSRDLTDRTRILYYRSVAERAQRAFPFLFFDEDPYLVVRDDGRLVWILDAYTATDRYPYAQHYGGGPNYMRNSVKVVVDAYDGRIRAFLADPTDPIIRTFARIYPGLLEPLDALEPDIRAHVRYPEDLFRAQTSLFATFHMSDPETFYHREDQWQIPGVRRAETTDAFVRHMVMRLPGEREPEFIIMRPFTPRQKDNLAAWMVARNDGEHYGTLIVYRFPRQSLVFGPTQIVNRINQDTDVARQVTLWDQRGSEVIRGELLVIPIEESLLYVQPLYLRAEGGRIPELKRVVVAHEGRVAMEETLDGALARLFGAERERASPPAVVSTSVPDEGRAALLREAVGHYDRARAAQRADDWATYGAEMKALGEVLRRLEGERP